MRQKKKINVLINPEEMPEYMRRFATASSKIKAIEAEIELQKQDLLKKYERRLQQLNEERDESVDLLKEFCEFHREDMFKSKKSLDTAHGTLGFRMGTPKLEKSKKLTWEMIIEDLKGIDPSFVRKKEEVNKELIISNRNDEEFMIKMKSIGVTVGQDETFFIEAKEEVLIDY